MPVSMAGATRVIVTRPSRDAQHWVRQLSACGFRAEALPLIEIGPVSSPADVQALHDSWRKLDSYDALMFVSGNAVAYFLEEKVPPAQEGRAYLAINNIANAAGNDVFRRLRFLAPGPGTATALVDAGVPPDQIDAPPQDAVQFDSEALWRVVGQRGWQGRRVLVVRGSHGGAASGEGAVAAGRDWLARQWQQAGAAVDFLSVYERRAPQLTDAQLETVRGAALGSEAGGAVWLFSSSEAVLNLTGAHGLTGQDWSRARAVATHPRIAEAVRAAGWGVVVASRPALADIVDALRSIESAYP